ncbi:MAG: 50S ribosomal protein L30 [Candidatus Dormibacteraceae bacterium]
MIEATWKKSAIGYSEKTKATVASLGFRKLNQTRQLPDNEAVRGLLRAVSFLVAVEGEPWGQGKRMKYKIWRKRSNKKHSRGR